MPTAAHFIYIPAMLLIGIVIGYVLGGRATRDAVLLEQAKRAARAARRRQEHEDSSTPPAKDDLTPPG